MFSAAGSGRWGRNDLTTSGALFLVTVLYLSAWPRNLGSSDEGYYLYHAKRMLDGAVLYRDIFDFITPLFTDVLAALFWLFRPDMATARLFNAVLHGAIAVVLYGTCRTIGVRWGLAVAVALAHLAIGQPAWPFVSPHWLSTLLTSLLLLTSIDRRRARQRRSVVAQGLLLGSLIAVHQQKGVVMAAGLAALLLLDGLIDRRYGVLPGPGPMMRFGTLVGATLVVVLPLLCVHAAMANVTLLVSQLVLHPFTGYRHTNYSPWGGYFFLSAGFLPYTSAPFLKYLPLTIPVGIAQAAPRWIARRQRERVETLSVLIVFSAFAILSISYFPDFIHISFIAPIFFVFLAAIMEGLLETVTGITGVPASKALAAASVLALFTASTVHLYRNMLRVRAEFPLPHRTAFGRVDFHTQEQITLIEKVRRVAQQTPTRELFCYPVYASMYLMTDTVNPTAHEIIAPGYQGAEVLQEVVETLEQRQVPQVLLVRLLVREGDPIAQYVDRNYRCGPDGLCLRRGIEILH